MASKPEEKTQTGISIPTDLYNTLHHLAQVERRTVSSLITILLLEALSTRQGKTEKIK